MVDLSIVFWDCLPEGNILHFLFGVSLLGKTQEWPNTSPWCFLGSACRGPGSRGVSSGHHGLLQGSSGCHMGGWGDPVSIGNFRQHKSPFLMGTSPFLMGKSQFLMGTSPFLMGK